MGHYIPVKNEGYPQNHTTIIGAIRAATAADHNKGIGFVEIDAGSDDGDLGSGSGGGGKGAAEEEAPNDACSRLAARRGGTWGGELYSSKRKEWAQLAHHLFDEYSIGRSDACLP